MHLVRLLPLARQGVLTQLRASLIPVEVRCTWSLLQMRLSYRFIAWLLTAFARRVYTWILG